MIPAGITTTIPSEILISGGFSPLDLNNLWLSGPNPLKQIELAEEKGFPRSLCSWVKGIYGVLSGNPQITRIVAVIEGDCSNTKALLEVLAAEKKEVVKFSYPYDRNKITLKKEMAKLLSAFNTTWKKAEKTRTWLLPLRKKLGCLDELTWKENLISGKENHLFLVSSSDWGGDLSRFETSLDKLLAQIKAREPLKQKLRLGYCGVPPIFSDLYDFLEKKNARVIYNEMQRQFSMPKSGENLIEQYLNYTYPYEIFGRLKDIKQQIKKRKIHGLIHYVQTFCHHQIEDLLLRKTVNIPVFTLEGDRPGPLEPRNRLRLEAFLEMLEAP